MHHKKIFTIISLLLTLTASSAVGEDFLAKKRSKVAESFDSFTFEPYGNEFQNRDLDGNGWPDFWEKIIDDEHDARLADAVRLVPDSTRTGALPGQSGYVLRVPFDGTGVAITTRVPIAIDPDMAYEISLTAKSLRLERSLTRLIVNWINIDKNGMQNILGSNHIEVPPGQIDWTEVPLRMRINNVPAKATHASLVISIYDNPTIPGKVDRHGYAWFDDIKISTRPKIYMKPTFKDYMPLLADDPPPAPVDFVIQYKGLVDNIPEEKGQAADQSRKSYYRVIKIADSNGRAPKDKNSNPLKLNFEEKLPIFPGALTSYKETLNVNLERLGVYYLTVALFGEQNNLLAEKTQVLGLWKPPLKKNIDKDEAAQSGGFGIIIDSIPEIALQKKGLLSNLVVRTGASYVKSIVWPETGDESNTNHFLNALSREFSLMRMAGIRITAMLKAPREYRTSQTLFELLQTRAKTMQPYTDIITKTFDVDIENWQWGDEKDHSFTRGVSKDDIAPAISLLAGKTSIQSQSFPVAGDDPRGVLPDFDAANAASIYIPENFTSKQMLESILRLAPHYFSIFKEPNRLLFPPAWLYDMSPYPKPVDETAAPTRKLEEWVSLSLKSVPPKIHDPRREREMLTDMSVKAVMARALGIPRTYVMSLIDENNGLARIDAEGEPIPMPALLGIRVLDQYLSGTKYLGSFYLRNEFGTFPNYVFAKGNNRDAIAVVWFDGKDQDEAMIDFGGGFKLNIVDLQGNIRKMAANTNFVATRTPQIITGMSVPFARTRMSINILRLPKLQMQATNQQQYLTITNFYDQSISGNITLVYAARNDFTFEQNWRVQPARVRFNIGRPKNDEPQEKRLTYSTRPPNSSKVDIGKEYGEKLVSVQVILMGDRPYELRLVRQTDLTGDVRIEMRRLPSLDDNTVDIIQMKLRWIPPKNTEYKREILLRPYYRKGDNLETLLPSVSVPMYSPNDTETPPVSIEFKIPKIGGFAETWVGYRQQDGSRFFNYNATNIIGPEVE